MPLSSGPRPNTQASTVGKRLFGTSNASVIQRKIQALDKNTLSAALKAQGVKGGMSARRVAEALTGKGGTIAQRHLAGMAGALQELGVTTGEKVSTGRLLTESTKRAQQDELYKATGALRPSAVQLGANASLGSRTAAAKLVREGGEVSEKPLEQARSIKEVRETLRSLGITSRKIPRAGLDLSANPAPSDEESRDL